MKNHTLFMSIAFIACLQVSVSAQIKTHELPAEEGKSNRIHVFNKNDTVYIRYDSAYIFNPNKYKKYKDLENYYEKMQTDPTSDAFKRMGNIYFAEVDSMKKLLVQLDKNSHAADSTLNVLTIETQRVLGIADAKLQNANFKLDTALIKLDSANIHLKTATAFIKREKKERFWKSVLYAGTGALVGFFIGFFAH